MLKISNIKLRYNCDNEQLLKKIHNILAIRKEDIIDFEILKKSIDARHKPDIYYIFSVAVNVKNENAILSRVSKKKNLSETIAKYENVEYVFPDASRLQLNSRPVIVGTGPAGLFCGYYLAKAGCKPILIERGKSVDERQRDVELFWSTGVLNVESNVQFGEGGAGTFSDGKLNTLVKDKYGRNREVLKTFVRFGAPESILYDYKPHIGTDCLTEIVKNLRTEIEYLGGTVLFNSKLTNINFKDNRVTSIEINSKDIIECDILVLAIGHSARDTFEMLNKNKIEMEPKPFAVGFRVMHEQSMINFSQYGTADEKLLGAAPYKITTKTSLGRGVYSFCMCPGGYVVNASSEKERLAVNGMSYSGRDGKYANSAIIVTIEPKDFGDNGPLSGMYFQRELEEKTYEACEGKIPVECFGDFEKTVNDNILKLNSNVLDKYDMEKGVKGAYGYCDLSNILPNELNRAFVEGMHNFNKQIDGFDNSDTMLLGLESRTSSPVKIIRADNCIASVEGIYPCGEGAGYAGGITSAAMDGIKIAEAIVLNQTTN